MTEPTISAIVPNQNMGRFLEDAVRSITRQRPQVAEILVVDSGSTDDSLDVVRRLQQAGQPLKLIQSEPSGPGNARNLALERATGELIAFLDADDVWTARKLELQTRRLAEQPQLSMVSGFVTYFEDLDPETLAPRAGSRTESMFHVHLGACLYRRELFERVGLFDPEFLYAEDVDLLLRIREAGEPFVIMRHEMLYYRRHPDSMMHQKNPRKQSDFRLAIMKSVRRRRLAGLPPMNMEAFEQHLEPLETAG